MEKKKIMSTTKSIGNCETASFMIVSKAKLVPISSKEVAAKHRIYEVLPSESNKSSRAQGHITKNKLKLPPISFEKSTKIAVASSTRFNQAIRAESCMVKAQLKPPVTSSSAMTMITEIDTTESTSITNSGINQSPISSRAQSEISSSFEHPVRPSQVRIVHNLTLVWLDSNVAKSNKDSKYSINQLYQIVDEIKLFAYADECIDYFRKEIDQTIFLIISNDLAQATISHIHHMSQLDSIYILCKNMPKQKRLVEQWSKVKDIFTTIDSIYERIRDETQICRRGSITISDTSIDLDRLDASFMYTKLLKEILLEMTYTDTAKKEFTQFWRQKCYVNKSDGFPKIIDEFEQYYDTNTPIWWYTRDCFLYDLVNRAFRLQDINVIIKIGFFIRDLQKRIEQLHIQSTEIRTFYRGQGLSNMDFEQLRTMHGGLFSFNSFLSTTTDKNLALFYAESCRENPELTGILFEIRVDPTILTSTRLASLDVESYYLDMEKEILFTMHTVFRIGEIKNIRNRLWLVKLSLTSDDDKDLKNLTDYIRQETQGVTGWDRLGKLLLKVGNFDKAEEVFQVLIDNSTENDMEKRGHHYHMMGLVKKCRNDYEEALTFFSTALEIYQNFPDSNHLDLATIYNDIGLVHKHTEKYSKALECYQKALEIQRQFKLIYNSGLAVTYNNIAEVHKTIEQYPEALQFHQKILCIHKKSIPLKFLNLAITYRNIGEMHYIMQDYPKALKLFRKVFRIQQNCLPINDTDTASIYHNIAETHEKIGDNSNALQYYENTRSVIRKSRPIDVSKLAIINNSIAQVYKNTKEFAKALEFYQETLRILDRYRHLKQPDLASTYDNIGQMYQNMGEYENAQLSYRRAINIVQQAIPQKYSHLQLYQEHLAEIPKRFS